MTSSTATTNRKPYLLLTPLSPPSHNHSQAHAVMQQQTTAQPTTKTRRNKKHIHAKQCAAKKIGNWRMQATPGNFSIMNMARARCALKLDYLCNNTSRTMLKLKQQMHWWRSTENWHPITQSTHTEENTSSTGAGITVSEASYHFPRKEVTLPMCHRCPPPCKVSCLSTTTRHMSEATSTQVHTTIWQLKEIGRASCRERV